MTPRETALALAEVGVFVLPLVGKQPDRSLTPHAVKNATNDRALIERWFATRPDLNVGIAIGIGALEAVRVLDSAPRNGGDATLAALVAEHGELPPTTTIASGRGDGGRHRYLMFPPGEYRGKLGPGLDLIGPGRYVVGPSSVHPDTGGRYEVVSAHDVGIADAPPWLVALARRPATADAPARARQPISTPTVERARRYLAQVDPAISGQHGHDATFIVASKLVRGFGLDAETAYAQLVNEWNDRCQPPWSERQLRRKVAEAERASRMTLGFLRDAERRA